jgi:hypothetical protein
MKRCFRCGKEKDISEFYKHPAMGDGHLGKCKNCTRRDVRENYDLKFEYYREQNREKFKQSLTNGKAAEWQRKRRASNVERYHANCAVSNALRDGRLVKQPCEVCGSTDVQAHHDDYSKPLEVRWLCFVHHRELHGQRNVSRGREQQKAA